MLINKSSKIISLFIEKPWISYTFNDIKKKLSIKSNSYLFSALKSFVENDILHSENIGNVIRYKLNLNDPKCISFISFIKEMDSWNRKDIPAKTISIIMSKIPTKAFSLLITGSYAKHKQTKNSDIDVVIICDDAKAVYSELHHLCEINIPKIHLFAFNESEFLSMLTNKEANYGKEIARNSLIFFGADIYYLILMEAINNGFNDKDIS